MDDFHSDKKKLLNTVKQFSLINFLFTGSRCLIKKYIISEMKRSKNKCFTFLDIGSGGGDIVFWLEKICRKNFLKVKIYCLDYDKRIIEYLKRCIRKRKLKNIKIVFDSVFNLEKIGKFDFIFANHFLHHFDNNDIIKIVKKIYSSTKKIFIINDLSRSKIIYFFYLLFAFFFLWKSFAFTDGLISIKKGFLMEEVKTAVKKISSQIKIKRMNPGRIYLFCKK